MTVFTYDVNERGIGVEANVRRWEDDLSDAAIDVRVCVHQAGHGHLQIVHVHLSGALQQTQATAVLNPIRSTLFIEHI